jgi:hypothetical protein
MRRVGDRAACSLDERRRRLRVMAAACAAAAAAGLAGCVSSPAVEAGPPPTPGGAIDRVLGVQLHPGFQAQVMVLGTSHLDAYRDRLRPDHLAPLLARLERFAPTHIAVEALPPDELALLAEREAHDPAASALLDMFGRGVVTAGQAMQEALGVARVEAERRADSILDGGAAGLTEAARLEAAAHLIAAYDFNSATLQWSYLSPAARQAEGPIPAGLRGALDRRLESANEVVTVALALARRLGHQRLYPVDSQYDGVRILAMPRDRLTALLGDPDRGRLVDREREARSDAVRDAAFEAGDLVPLYVHLNSEDHQVGDASQWNWLFQGRYPEGEDRFRYALWEVRNLRQATRIVDLAASPGAERVLVVVGASHKAPVERVLATQLTVRLVPFNPED